MATYRLRARGANSLAVCQLPQQILRTLRDRRDVPIFTRLGSMFMRTEGKLISAILTILDSNFAKDPDITLMTLIYNKPFAVVVGYTIFFYLFMVI